MYCEIFIKFDFPDWKACITIKMEDDGFDYVLESVDVSDKSLFPSSEKLTVLL